MNGRHHVGRYWLLLLSIGIASFGALANELAENSYSRIGYLVEQMGDTVFLVRHCNSSTQVPLYGCGQGPDGYPYRTIGAFKLSNGLSLGIGLRVSSRFRVELLGEFGRS